MSEKLHEVLHTLRARWPYLLAGALLGAFVILVIRFAAYQNPVTHYHANFAVYLNGNREQFKNPDYYQEIKICSLNGTSPLSRAHMHNEDNGVIHIHDSAVTWGQFFENIGWMVGPDFIRSQTTLYQASGDNKLNIVLNGQDLTGLTNITNQVIQDKDRLLISYGPSDNAVLAAQYKTVPDTAARYDAQKDPASCGGSEVPTFKQRLTHLF